MTTSSSSFLLRLGVFAFGLVSYAIFFATFLYAIGFVGGLVVPRSIDSTPERSAGIAFLIDAGLLAVFAIQHSVMARPAFKAFLARFVPVAAERSNYVLMSSLALILVFAAWQPIGGVVWQVENPVGVAMLWTGFAAGWLIVLITTFLINHFDLFGLRQVWNFFNRQQYVSLKFVTPGPYKWVRHPLYVGWLFAFWFTPTMTSAHLVFALLTTAYILIAIQLEERDLVAFHGADYAEYRLRTPMIIPRPPREAALSGKASAQI